MPRTALTILAWSFTCIQVFGDTQDSVKNSKDNVSEESVKHVYTYNPLGLYASANPHDTYSFQDPTIASSNSEVTQLLPAKEESQTIVPNSNDFLKDSYGNRLVETPQNVAYTTVLPQHSAARYFIPLQDLPPHLAQPLLASTPSYQFRTSGQFAYGVPYNYNKLHSSPSSPAANQFTVRMQPYGYAANVRNFSPISAVIAPIGSRTTPFGHLINTATVKTLRQHSNHKPVYTFPQNNVQYSKIKQDPTFQRGEKSIAKNPPGNWSHKTNKVIHEEKTLHNLHPTTQTITTFVNGKKTVINVETRPTLPQLDIRLLKPLTFANPVVPQMQHFLPKIPMATYKNLPEIIIDESQKQADEFHGIAPDKPSYETTKPEEQNSETSDDEGSSESAEREQKEESEPDQRDYKNDSEKKSPNYTETINEQVVSYTKETQNEPQTYGYSKQTQNKPVEYTYSNQKEQKPVHYTYIYDSKKPFLLKEINYEEEDNRSKEVNDKRNIPVKTHSTIGTQHVHPHYQTKHQNEIISHNQPKHRSHNPQHEQQHHHPQHEQQHHHPQHEQQHHHPQHEQQHHHPQHEQQHHHPQHEQQHHHPQHEQQHQLRKDHHPHRTEKPKDSSHLQPEHRNEQHANHLNHKKNEHVEMYYQSHPIHIAPVLNMKHITSTKKSAKPSNQHDLAKQDRNHYNPAEVQHMVKHHDYHTTEPAPYVRVIVQDETPDEKHSHHEKMAEEEVDNEENSEEDFEKAYKNSAYGFPAFNRDSSEEEKIYDPESYGVPKYAEFKIENNLFRPYQKRNDEYPKSMRENYKNASDKNKENYYLDYSIIKPESLLDQYQKKIDYYKMFRKPEPGYFASVENKKPKPAKYTSQPYFTYNSQPKKISKQLGHYYSTPDSYEYDYSKEAPRDSTARVLESRVHHKTNSNTQFVEPQYQSGFEPLALPPLLDSELAAMASNDTPGSEKPLRKKIYKENFYIKKTSTTAGKPDS